ncbi:MAG TPA: Nudix family hydrolase [Limnobacter sp.]|uniref:Nudix family hydrolase n=1 Tax=Limnobacter sp. TaxID=2003368 RepID=UPI002E36E776|nr:Nudix family hydrolase [Limnobacter sp.]HEX5487219.1 Nudix family hydrolase [Limnobacter sp.]
MTKRVDVAVGVVCRPDGTVLWGSRPEGKPYAGYWEFPGGKVEPGESVWQALVRELREELGIEALQGGPWFIIEHDYEHAKVRLHLYRVWEFKGEPASLENQHFCWAGLQPDSISPILPATAPMLPVLNQPTFMAITGFQQMGTDYAHRLEAGLKAHAAIVQFRETGLSDEALVESYRLTVALCERYRASLCINSATYQMLLDLADTYPDFEFEDHASNRVHLTHADLLKGTAFNARAVGASVHCPESLALAFDQGLQYAVLGAVKETGSHPGQKGIGWQGFAQMVEEARLPVYAVGGLSSADLNDAWRHGAHGVAMISAWGASTSCTVAS